MKIKLNKLTLVNFKGTRNKTINFSNQTSIYGDNATGKTTVFDAFLWLLFGKDSDDRSDFSIKTLDSNGKVIEKIDHEVEGVLEVDGKTMTFKRVLREKWVKKRGSEDTQFEGNETVYFVDEVPCKAKEFQDKISDIIDERLFKMITSPTAFNSLKWQDRRELLIDMVGDVNKDEVISGMDMSSDRKQWLIELLASDQTIDEHNKRIAAQIKRDKEELKMIPTRIDEAQRSKVEVPAESFDEIKRKLSEAQTELDTVEGVIRDSSLAINHITTALKSKKENKYRLESEVEEIEREARKKAKEAATPEKFNINDFTTKKKGLEDSIKYHTEELTIIEEEIKKKRSEWEEKNSQAFRLGKAEEVSCLACKRPFSEEVKQSKLADMENTFNVEKKEALEKITTEGKRLAERKKMFEATLSDYKTQLEELNNQIKAEKEKETKQVNEVEVYEKLIRENKKLPTLKEQIEVINTEIKELEDSMVKPDEEANKKRIDLTQQIDELKTQLRKEEDIKRTNQRIKELKEHEKTLSQSIAGVERSLFVLEAFTKSRITAIENKINERFTFVSFKMFEDQINGGEKPTCVCMVDGVPFSDLNTAMKTNAGLDIIKTLSEHYKTKAPIFIDHRESITTRLELDTQFIDLIVSQEDKELRIV